MQTGYFKIVLNSQSFFEELPTDSTNFSMNLRSIFNTALITCNVILFKDIELLKYLDQQN